MGIISYICVSCKREISRRSTSSLMGRRTASGLCKRCKRKKEGNMPDEKCPSTWANRAIEEEVKGDLEKAAEYWDKAAGRCVSDNPARGLRAQAARCRALVQNGGAK